MSTKVKIDLEEFLDGLSKKDKVALGKLLSEDYDGGVYDKIGGFFMDNKDLMLVVDGNIRLDKNHSFVKVGTLLGIVSGYIDDMKELVSDYKDNREEFNDQWILPMVRIFDKAKSDLLAV